MIHFCQGLPIILVGCKKDLRDDPRVIEELAKNKQAPVSTAEGEAVAAKIGAYKYIECSAKSGDGVKDTSVSFSSLFPERQAPEEEQVQHPLSGAAVPHPNPPTPVPCRARPCPPCLPPTAARSRHVCPLAVASVFFSSSLSISPSLPMMKDVLGLDHGR